jgi:hypothetical protein
MVMEIPLAGKNLIVARKFSPSTLTRGYLRLGGYLRKVMSDADEGTLSRQFSIYYGPIILTFERTQSWATPPNPPGNQMRLSSQLNY